MSSTELSINRQYVNKKLIINVTSWMRNHTANLCNTVSATAAVTRDSLAERLQSKGEAGSTFYNRIMNNNEYGRNRFKVIVEK